MQYSLNQMQLDISSLHSRHKHNISSDNIKLVIWECAPQDFCKINWDVAVDKRQCKIGIGVAVRDEVGSFLATLRKKKKKHQYLTLF